MAGKRFPVVRNYEFLAELGSGTLGTTFKVLNRRSQDLRALKLVRDPSDDLRERLKRDVHALSRIEHPALVRCLEYGEEGDQVFVATELIDGKNLAQALAASAASEEEWTKRAVFLFGQLLKALAHLHGSGILHRGVKPTNVLVNRDGRVKLADAALGRSWTLAELEALPPETWPLGRAEAPEQLLGVTADARLDLYATGLALADAIGARQHPAGQDPGTHGEKTRAAAALRAGEPLLEQLRARARGEGALRFAGSPTLAPLATRLLARRPEERPASAAETIALLRSAWDTERKAEAAAVAAAEPEAEKDGITLPIVGGVAMIRARLALDASAESPLERTNEMNKIPDPAAGGSAARAGKSAPAAAGRGSGAVAKPRRGEKAPPPAASAAASAKSAARSAEPAFTPDALADPRTVSDAAITDVLRAAKQEEAPALEAALVGRDAEIAHLEALFEAARGGRTRLVALSGEAGIGKTRLVAELAARLRLHGALVLAGRAGERHESRHGAVGALLDDVARELARLDPAERARRLPHATSALSAISPRFRDLLATDTGEEEAAAAAAATSEHAPNEGEPLDQQRRVLEVQAALAEVLVSLAARRPVVVLLHDLHSSSAETVAIVTHLVRALAGVAGTDARGAGNGAAVLPIATYRAEELPTDHPLARALVELDEEGLLERLELARLKPEDTNRLAATMSGLEETPAALLAHLQRETEGNPLYLVESMKLLREEGVLTTRDGRVRFDARRLESLRATAPDGTAPAVAAGILEVVRRRLARLSSGALEVLELVSIAGTEVGFELLHLATGRSEEEVLDAVVELLRARILVEPEDRLATYSIDHEKTREVVLASMKPRPRRTRAGRLARAVEQRAGTRRLERAVELASLFEQAQDPEKLVEYLPAAVEALARDGELERALARSDRLLELLGSNGSASVELEARRVRGRILLLLGRLDEAAVAFTEARDRAASVRNHGAEVDAWNGLSEAAWRRGDLDGARRLAEGALERARGQRLHPGEAAARENLGVVLRRTYDVKAASRHLREALRIRRKLGDEAGAARVLSSLGLLFRNQDNYALASTHFREAHEIHERRRDRLGSALSLSALASIHARLNEFDRATALYVEALALDEAMGNRRGVALCREGLGTVSLTQGDYERARQSFTKALEVFRRIGDRHNAAYSLINLGHTEFRSGRPSDAAKLYREAVVILEETGNRVSESEARSGLALALDAMGEREAAEREATAAVAMAREKGAREKEAWARHTLSRVSASLEEAEKALVLAESVGSDNLMFMVHHQIARLHLERSEREEAREHFQRAFTIIDAIAERTGHAKEMFLSKPPVVAVFKDARRL